MGGLKMVFVDSNIWCYYFDSSAEEHEQVSEFLEELIGSDEDIHINTVVLMEVGHFLVKNLGGIKGKKNLKKMMEFQFSITDLTYDLTTDSLDILAEEHQTGIGGRDSTIIATMKEKSIDKLVTHDQSFKKVDGIEVKDPITE